jgi:acyl-CoA thioester hydrolase
VTTAYPTYDELAALTAYAPQSVPTAFEDINGHLNIRHYVGIASEGLDESLSEVGIPQNWPTVAGQAVFSAEHHMTYLSELRTGDRISVRVRLIGRSARAAHVVAYLLDDTHQQVSYVMEEIFLHIDMASRRSAEWPEDVAAALDRRIAADADLAWQPTLSGSMSLR